MTQSTDTSFIPDLPKGPLCSYRNRVNFDWKRLRLIFEKEQGLRVKYEVWKILENDPLFSYSIAHLPTDDQTRICAIQMNRMADLIIPHKDMEERSFSEKTKYLMSINEALHTYCPTLSMKIAFDVVWFNHTIRNFGTERHRKYYEDAWNREVVTSLREAEVSDGSITNSIRTTATYDPAAQEFIINTPDSDASKCCLGNLRMTATMALTLANLYTPDGINRGVHGFLIPIRDPKTLQPYPGLLVGDMGKEINGVNAINDGFVTFANYRIPRENLLNRWTDVTTEGLYKASVAPPSKAYCYFTEVYFVSRVAIMQESVNTLSNAAVIAVRYNTIRKFIHVQNKKKYLPLIENPIGDSGTFCDIFRYLAAACVLKIYVAELTEESLKFIEKNGDGTNDCGLTLEAIREMDAIIFSSNTIISRREGDAIQTAIDSCSCHGYLKASKLVELRNNHDDSSSYGNFPNNLFELPSDWLLIQWNHPAKTPLNSVNFLSQREMILTYTALSVSTTHEIESVAFALTCHKWLLCYLLKTTSEKITENANAGSDYVKSPTNYDMYHAELPVVFAQYYCLSRFVDRIQRPDITEEYAHILKLVSDIYGMWCLDRHMITFYLGGFASGPIFSNTIRTLLLQKCAELKDSAVSVADALAPPDFALNSVIAKSDGFLYENLQKYFMTNPGAFELPEQYDVMKYQMWCKFYSKAFPF